MIRFLTILTILAFSASQGFTTPLDLVVTGGSMTTEVTTAGTGGPTIADESVLAAMPLSTSSTVVLGSTSTAATYNFTNAAGLASFDIQPITQDVVANAGGGVNFGFDSTAKGQISFQLNEAADYSVTGAQSGTSTLANNYNSFWVLRDIDNVVEIFSESEFSQSSADHQVNGLDDSNAFFQVTGNPTGTLPPGNYRFDYELYLENSTFGIGTGDAAGFANLTLTRVIPEPASAVLMLLTLVAAAVSRGASRIRSPMRTELIGYSLEI